MTLKASAHSEPRAGWGQASSDREQILALSSLTIGRILGDWLEIGRPCKYCNNRSKNFVEGTRSRSSLHNGTGAHAIHAKMSCRYSGSGESRIGRSRAVPCCGSAGLSRASNCGVLGLPTVTPVRFVGREHRQCDRDAWQSGIARENAVRTMIVMAVARCTITAVRLRACGSARPLNKCLYAIVWIGVFNNTYNSTCPRRRWQSRTRHDARRQGGSHFEARTPA